ncbi:hypothetical protein SAY86_014642 [Trapa natans]|uniref:Uncharacterized protein n=1 Tax=Trapa natans TaxID=22666 RepID=A0AAN7QG37_TRANT|nr:hypothetical protein SAY86_014642 [Trapa natans]
MCVWYYGRRSNGMRKGTTSGQPPWALNRLNTRTRQLPGNQTPSNTLNLVRFLQFQKVCRTRSDLVLFAFFCPCRNWKTGMLTGGHCFVIERKGAPLLMIQQTNEYMQIQARNRILARFSLALIHGSSEKTNILDESSTIDVLQLQNHCTIFS